MRTDRAVEVAENREAEMVPADSFSNLFFGLVEENRSPDIEKAQKRRSLIEVNQKTQHASP